MKTRRLLWLLATIALAASTSLVVNRIDSKTPHSHNIDLHHWMHSQLNLTPDQHRALAPIEAEFEATRKRLQNRIDKAGHQLAASVRESDRTTPATRQALEALNRAQTDLQQATLEHFFAMKEHLDPDQAELLIEWTHDSILHQ
ncbi:MAG: periplasmic heavy metal sensor [Verrucomicrobiales bacterium]